MVRLWAVMLTQRVSQPAALGDSLGNHFRITLRRCHPSAAAVHSRLLRCSGQFINYFGVQRVGEVACVLHAACRLVCGATRMVFLPLPTLQPLSYSLQQGRTPSYLLQQGRGCDLKKPSLPKSVQFG